jgi:dipeptidase
MLHYSGFRGKLFWTALISSTPHNAGRVEQGFRIKRPSSTPALPAKMANAVLLLQAVGLFILFPLATSCSTLVVGKLASSDGSVMAVHTNDGEGHTDGRIVSIAAADYAVGSLRPIYFANEAYPRHVGGLSPAYSPDYPGGAAGYKLTKPIGFIPQVLHTYSYFEATYGIMNEHQVGIAESTCSSRFSATSVDQGGKALLSIDALSRIALERSNSSREAVQLMGDLAVKFGFYGPGFEGTGESLHVIDPNEGFVFHVLPDPSGTSAIWVAQRVPDDAVSAVDNMFIIREVSYALTYTPANK